MPKVAWKVVREVKAPQFADIKRYVIAQRGKKCKDHKAGDVTTLPCLLSCKVSIVRNPVEEALAIAKAKQAAKDFAVEMTAKTQPSKVEDEDLVSTYIESLADRYLDRSNDTYRAEAKLSRNGNYGDPVTVQVGLYLKPLNLYWVIWQSHAFTREVSAKCKYCNKRLAQQTTHSNEGLIATGAAHYYECAMIRHWIRKEQNRMDRSGPVYV